MQGFTPQRWVEMEQEDWHAGFGGKTVKKIPRGVPFEAYVVMETTEW